MDSARNKRRTNTALITTLLLGLAGLYLLCTSRSTAPVYGTLNIELSWTGSDTTVADTVPNGIAAIGVTVVPDTQALSFSPENEVFTVQTELGIYNVTVRALDDSGVAVYGADTVGVLVRERETTSLLLMMQPRFPTDAPSFAGLPALTVTVDSTYTLAWHPVDTTMSYQLEEAGDSLFTQPVTVYSGTDTAYVVTGQSAGTYYYRVRAENDVDASPWSATVAFEVHAAGQMVITTTAAPAGTVAAAYALTLQAAGGTAPVAWSLVSGTLPAGLSLDNAAGTVTGTPVAAGTSAFAIQAIDAGTPVLADTAAFQVIVYPVPLVLGTGSLPGGTEGEAYQAYITAQGGTPPYVWSITGGNLPAGLDTTAGETLVISGTPTENGSFGFTVRVTDNGSPSQTQSVSFSLDIAARLLSITTSAVSTGRAGSVYYARLDAAGTGADWSWALVAGSLPAGVTLGDSGTYAVVSGTPADTGTSVFSVQVTDNAYPSLADTQEYYITVLPPLTVLQFVTDSLPAGVEGRAYAGAVRATGGTPPYRWSITAGALPAGLDTTAGDSLTINGTPADTGLFTVTVRVTDDSAATVARSFSLRITSALRVVTTTLPSDTAGNSYSASLTAGGGTSPYTWTLVSGGLPSGLSLSAAGAITGTAAAAGTSAFTVQVTDAGTEPQNTTQALSIIIHSTVLRFVTNNLPSDTVGNSYSASLTAAGGTPPYAWTLDAGSLPSGLSLSAAGAITGTAAAAGTSAFTVRVTDAGAQPQTVTQPLRIVIHPTLLRITTTSLPSDTVGGSYSAALAATGGTPSYTWSVISGTLPAGLSLNASTGAVTGTPSAQGTQAFSVRVTDAGSPAQSDTVPLSITIYAAAFTITTASLPDGVQWESYTSTLCAANGDGTHDWTISNGTAPNGLDFDFVYVDNTCIDFMGWPSDTGSFTFTVQAVDGGVPQDTAWHEYTIHISPPPVSITTGTSLTDALEGQAYAQALAATGGSGHYAWSVVSGSLPTGISLADENTVGRLTGTPTTDGSYTFGIAAADDAYPLLADTVSFSLTVRARLAITTGSLPDGKAGVAYDQTLQATGGMPPYTWNVISGAASAPEPIGMGTAGTVSGTYYGGPTTWNFTVTVKDSGSPVQRDTADFSLYVAAGDLELFAAYLPQGTLGTAYNGYILYRLGTPPLRVPWEISGNLPTGVSVSAYYASNYQASFGGTPTVADTFEFYMTVYDSATVHQTRTDTFSIIIE